MKKPIIDLVITDLDNTLYDWFEPWYHAFSAFLRSSRTRQRHSESRC